MPKLSNEYKIIDVPAELVYVDSDWNSRGDFTEQSILELAQEIEADELQTPPQVQPASDVLAGLPAPFQYRLIVGFRRFAAVTRVLGWKVVPAFLVTGLSEQEARERNLIENIERVDLTVMQQATAISKMFPAGTSASEICRRLKKSKGWVHLRLALVQMPKEIQDAAISRELEAGDIMRLSRLPPEEQLRKLREFREFAKNYVSPKTHHRRLRPRMDMMDGKGRKSRAEMLAKMVEITDQIGEGPWTWALAWAAGKLSEKDLDSAIDNCADLWYNKTDGTND